MKANGKRVVAVLLAVIFAWGLLGGLPKAAGAVGPTVITTPAELDAIRNNLSGSYVLGNDIDLTAYVSVGGAGYNGGAGWNPIGGWFPNQFSGTFDGQGYTISGLYINRPTTDYVGLFSTSNGTIRNVGLVGGGVTGRDLVGALAGYSGTITNAWATTSVNGRNNVGGLLGYQDWGTLSKSYATGNVTGTGANVGGLVGFMFNSQISNSYARGNVAGGSRVSGLLGYMQGGNGNSITNSYATGAVSGGATGGLIGVYEGTVVSNAFYDSQTTGQSDVGKGTAKTTAEMTTAATFTGAGWNFTNIWAVDAGTNGGYPYLPRTYTVTYSGNGNTSGSAPTDSNTYVQGATVTVLGNTGSLAKTGYNFTGWNTAADGSGTSRAAGSTFSMGGASVTLYAKWLLPDTTAPSGTVSIAGGAAATNNTSVTLTLAASDNVAVTEMQFSNDDSTWSGWEAYGTSKSWTLAAGADGTRTVYVKFKDAAGNVSATANDSITLDTVAPSGTVMINGGSALTYSSAVSLTLSATDAAAGVAEMRFSNDNSTWSAWELYATTKAHALAGGYGSKTVYAQFRDAVGNSSASASDGIEYAEDPVLGDASLGGLGLSHGMLAPPFSANTTNYAVSVPHEVTSVSVSASAAVSIARVSTRGGEDLKVGSNTVTVTVTAANGTTRTYSVTVNRAPSANADLGGFGRSAGTVTPAFRADVTAYTVTIPAFVTSMSISATAADRNTTVNVNGVSGAGGAWANVSPGVGSTTVSVAVTAQDGKTVKTYTFTIIRPPVEEPSRPVIPDAPPALSLNLSSGSGDGVDLDQREEVRPAQTAIVGTHLVVTMDEPGQGASGRPPAPSPVEVRAVEVPAPLVSRLAGTDSQIAIRTSVGSLSIPAAAVADSSQPANVSYRFRMEAVDTAVAAPTGSVQLTIRSVNGAENQGLRSAGRVLSLTAERVVRSANGTSNAEPIRTFARPVVVRIPFGDAHDPASLGVYRLNEQTGQWEFRGGTVNVAERYMEVELDSFSQYTVMERVTFDDVQQHWARSAIERLAVRRIVTSAAPGLFAPDRAVTRAEFTAWMVRLLKLSPVAEESPFTDVPASEWYAADLRAAARAGLVKGDGGLFRPEATISRQELVTILLRAARTQNLKLGAGTGSLAGYRDADQVAEWAREAMLAAIDAGLIRGRGENLLEPAASTTRAETVVLLERLLNLGQ